MMVTWVEALKVKRTMARTEVETLTYTGNLLDHRIRKKKANYKFQISCFDSKMHSCSMFLMRKVSTSHMENYLPSTGGAEDSRVPLSHRKIVSRTSTSWGLETHLLLVWFHQGQCQRSPWPFKNHLLLSHIAGVQHHGNGMTGGTCKYLGALSCYRKSLGTGCIHFFFFNVVGN